MAFPFDAFPSSLADRARQHLEEVGKPMRVTEIADALVKRGWVTSRLATEAIRTAMGRQKKEFERVALGVYALVEWPAAKKRLIPQTARPWTPRKRRVGPQGLLPPLIRAVLLEQQKPLTFKEIISFIEADGRKVNKGSAIRAIYRCIKRDRLFYLVSPGVFGLRE